MYTVSDKYKVSMNQMLREKSEVNIVFGLISQDAPSASTPTDNGHTEYSQVATFDVGTQVNETTETLEKNRFFLDGVCKLPTRGEFPFQGYVGNELSGDDKLYTNIPTVTITFSQPLEFVAFTLRFDEIKGDYPEILGLKAYNNNVEVLNKTYNPTGVEFITPEQIPTCNKIVLEYRKSHFPRRRARIFQLLYGIIVTVTNKDLTSMTISNKTEPLSMELPSQTMDFTMMDMDGEFDPENPNSKLKYFEQGQFAETSLKQTLYDGSIETIPLSKTYFNGEVTTDRDILGTNLTIKTSTQFDWLDTEYNGALYYANGRSYYDLITDALTFAGYSGAYQIDNTLKTKTTKVVLSGKSVKEFIQTVANAGGCYIRFDRTGQMIVKPFESNVADVEYSLSTMYGYPTLNRTALLRNIVTKYVNVSLETSAELASLEVTSVVNQPCTITFDSATNVTYSVSGVTVVGTPVITANKIEVVLNGTGKITVTGNKLKYTDVQYVKQVNQLGYDLETSNPLIDSRAMCDVYSTNLANYYSKRNSYEFENRGFPETDVMDSTVFDTQDYLSETGIVIENTITFDGTLSAKTKVLSNSTK